MPVPVDGTLLGHFQFLPATASVLTRLPVGVRGDSCTWVHRHMAEPLRALFAAAAAEEPGLGRDLVALSCHRSIAYQARIFCNPRQIARRGYADQARWIAPPGFSEHATGLAVDFGARSAGACNLEPCFAATRAGRWLAANARRFGFEMSFPADNAQGVGFEPWHFRFVGDAAADAVFAHAKSSALPSIGEPGRIAAVPEPPIDAVQKGSSADDDAARTNQRVRHQ